MRISFNSNASTRIITARLKTEDILLMHDDAQVLVQPRRPAEQLRGATICEGEGQGRGWRCQRVSFIVPDTGLFAESPADNRVRR